MAINPVVYTEKIVRSFLKYQLSAYPFSDPRLHTQMRELLSIDKVRRTPLLRDSGRCISSAYATDHPGEHQQRLRPSGTGNTRSACWDNDARQHWNGVCDGLENSQ